jgi:hypothetical protein
MPLMRILGLIHYVLTALALLGVVAAIVEAVSIANLRSSDPDVFGLVIAIGDFVAVGISFAFLAALSFLLGNRLLCRRSRGLCIALAVGEFLWGLLPGVLIALFSLIELTPASWVSTIEHIVDVILCVSPAGIPIVLAIATVVLVIRRSVPAAEAII